VSATCPKPTFIDDAHFLRISINDGHGEKILPFFDVAFRFVEKCRKANAKVLIHCLAGISRSPTLAIAYLMKHLALKSDEAYKFVKEKRKTISPNFNFLGQLYEYEKQLIQQQQQQQQHHQPLPYNTSIPHQSTSLLPESSSLLSSPNPATTTLSAAPTKSNSHITFLKLSKKSSTTGGMDTSTTTSNASGSSYLTRSNNRKRQFIFRFNTSSNDLSVNQDNEQPAQAGPMMAFNSTTTPAVLYSTLLSPSQALSNFNLNSPTDSSAHSPFTFASNKIAAASSLTSHFGLNKSKTMDVISTITTATSLRRPTNLQMAEEQQAPSKFAFANVVGGSATTTTTTNSGVNLLKRPSSILLGASSSGGSGSGQGCCMSSPKQQLNKEVLLKF
jgi:hypothetical protein